MNTSNIYLCSTSEIKIKAAEYLVKTLSELKKKSYTLSPESTSYQTPEQPLDEITAFACSIRINIMEKKLTDENRLHDGDLIISIENGIFNINNNYYDVSVLMIYDRFTRITTRYNSFGIMIDTSLYALYQKYRKPNQTFGWMLNYLLNVKSNNWSSDPKFGNIDRTEQIKDAMNKYLIDHMTSIIPNYPKQGVMFKHMTSIITNPLLLEILFKLLERFIRDNFNVNKIDYFAGLDARGFYFAPTLAHIFKKGFIPVRKAGKIPKTDTTLIATESYGTEYSSDEFGLEHNPEYSGKNVLIIDDLLATGGSFIGSASVLTKVGLSVVGAVTVYDVDGLRETARKKLSDANIQYKVLINENNVPNDFMQLDYKFPDITLKNMSKLLSDKEIRENMGGKISENITGKPNKFTLSSDEWLAIDGLSAKEIELIDSNKMNNVTLIYADKDTSLATKILGVMNNQMGTSIKYDMVRTPITTGKFSNGEPRIKIDANIRNKHVIIITQMRTGYITDDFMELMFILDACNRAGSDKITVVMPYYPCSRSDKKDDPRCPIGAALIAEMLDLKKIHNLVSVDLHAGQIQGYLDKGFHNLYMKRYICDFIHSNYLQMYNKTEWNDHYILIAPDAGSAKTVKGYSKLLEINNIIMDKQRDYSQPGTVVASRFIGSKDEFKGKIGLIIDDMADTMGTMCAATQELVDNGLKGVIVLVTHGILSGPAIQNINNSEHIIEVIVSDTLPQDHNILKSPKIRVISSAELIARTIDGILTGRSISRLF
jgi:ribose-phosphate pyrophosphokinase